MESVMTENAGLGDRLDAQEVVARFVTALDLRDWDAARTACAATVRWDYESVNGRPAADVPIDALVAGWRGGLGGSDGSQHLLGAGVTSVDGDVAEHRAHAQVTVRLEGAEGGPEWRCAVHYVATLGRVPGGWVIAGLRARLLWSAGNASVMRQAAERAEQRRGA